jgi:hypothetical protein
MLHLLGSKEHKTTLLVIEVVFFLILVRAGGDIRILPFLFARPVLRYAGSSLCGIVRAARERFILVLEFWVDLIKRLVNAKDTMQ